MTALSSPCIEAPGRAQSYPKTSTRREVPGRSIYRLRHRVAFEAAYRPLEPGETVDHLCFNTRCIQPLHLEAVSRAENSRRAWAAGRYRDVVYTKQDPTQPCIHGHPPNWRSNGAGTLRCATCANDRRRVPAELRRPGGPGRKFLPGVGNGVVKLTADRVREMRALRAAGWYWKDLAVHFGVSVWTVRSAVNGLSWTHV